MKKIDVSDVCAEYTLDKRNFQKALDKGASVAMTCSTCYYILFAYCHYEDRYDPVVIRALEDNHEAKKMIHDKIQKLEEADGCV